MEIDGVNTLDPTCNVIRQPQSVTILYNRLAAGIPKFDGLKEQHVDSLGMNDYRKPAGAGFVSNAVHFI